MWATPCVHIHGHASLVFPPLFSALLLLSRPIRQCARLCPTQSLSPVISARPGHPRSSRSLTSNALARHTRTHAPYYAAPISDGGPARIRTRDALTLSHETHHLQRTLLTCDHISPTSPPPKTLRPAIRSVVSTGCPRSRRRRRSLRSRPARSIPWRMRRGSPCRPRPSRPDLPASSPRSCARPPRRRRGACRRR